MKSISFWAKTHRPGARFLILLLYVPFNLFAITAGEMFFELHGALSSIVFATSISLLLTGIICFQRRRKSYYQRIGCHGLMLAASFGLIGFSAGQIQTGLSDPAYTIATAASISAVPAAKPVRLAKRAVKTGLARYTYRRLLKMVALSAKQPGRPLSEGEKVLFVVLSIAGGVVLSLLLAALCCSIACSGGEAIAVILFGAGVAGIAIGLTLLIKHIVRSPTREPVDPYAFHRRVFAASRRGQGRSVN